MIGRCFVPVAGVDEAGRGPLAGPVIAAAVILNPRRSIEGVADSKTLSEKQRNRLEEKIIHDAVAWAIGRAEVEEIDRLNILQATLLAMRRAVLALNVTPVCVLVDGKHCPALPCAAEPVVGGDGLVPAISAASILAKVARDREMIRWDRHYPQYGFARHKGYPTKMHFAALKAHGVTPIHRRSYAPVKALCV